MKINLLLAALFIIGSTAMAHAQGLTKIWEATENLPTPESVLFNPKNNLLYVSLIDGRSTEKDGIGGIAILNPDGSMKNPNWVTDLNAPKGMAIYQDLLFVADITDVVVVDMVSGNVVDVINIPTAAFLNDVTVDDKGVVYVSDTRKGEIYAIKNGEAVLFCSDLPAINGLKFNKGTLLALVGPEIWAIDSNKKTKVLATGFERDGDGIELVGNGDYLVTCWPGIIYYVKADGTHHKMLDVQGTMNTADLGYDPKAKVLYVPTFNANSVVAYQLK